MTLLLAAVALAAIAAGWVIAPIVRRRLALLGDPVAGGIIDADARKRVALSSLREIEYDRIGGKLDDEDYHRLRAQLEREALLAIDAAERAGSAGPGTAAPGTAAPAERPSVEAPTVTHACGFVNPLGSRFCAGCGARL